MNTNKKTICCGIILAGLLLAGCGGNNTATVSGVVSFNGEQLPSGTVSFMGANSWVGSSNINSGAYKIEGVPLGEVKISVQTFPPSPGVVPPGTPPSSVTLPSLKYVAVPQEYADFSTTPLRMVVTESGAQPHDIELAGAK